MTAIGLTRAAWPHGRLYEPPLLTGMTPRRAFDALAREGLVDDGRAQTGRSCT